MEIDSAVALSPGRDRGRAVPSHPMTRRPRLLEFDALRALLAWWVVCEHTYQPCGVVLREPLHDLLFAGHAVDVFMLLSGFVIFMLLDSAREPMWAFMIRRFFRLYPVYLPCALLGLTLWVATPHPVPAAGMLAANLFLLQGAVPEFFCPHVATTILPPSWSISLEWQFYLLAPCLFYALRKRLGLALAIMLLSAGIGEWLRRHQLFVYPSFLPLRLHLFLLGAATYFGWERVLSTTRWHLARFAPLAGLTVFLATRSVSLAIWAFFAFLTLGATPGDTEPAHWLVRPLRAAWVQGLGQISYSTYLIHFPVIQICARVMGIPRSGQNPWLQFGILSLAVAPVTLVASLLLHYGIENPCIAFGRRLVRSMGPVPAFPPTGNGAAAA